MKSSKFSKSLRAKFNSCLFLLLGSLTGCGSLTDSTPKDLPPRQSGKVPTGYIAIPNRTTPGRVVLKSLDLTNGTGRILNSASTGGDRPVLIKSLPILQRFYVLNADSSSISTFSLGSEGIADFVSTIDTPPRPKLLVIHPSGGFAYCAGDSTVRTYSIDNNGNLTSLGDTSLTHPILSDSDEPVADADFTSYGGFLHLPEEGAIESFTVRPNGRLGSSTLISLPNPLDHARAVNVNPVQDGAEVIVRSATGNDRILSYEVNQAQLGQISGTTGPAEARLGVGSFAYTGQYYVGSRSSGRIYGFAVASPGGALTPLAGSPYQIPGSTSDPFVVVDQLAGLVVSTGGSTNLNRLDSLVRGPSGALSSPTSDDQGLTDPGLPATILYYQ
jgi:hypothetical protein